MKIDKRVIPHIFTFGNLCLGMLAIILAILEKGIYGSILILIAGFLDRFDGAIARKLGVESELGKELDSLSDLVSFGLAPSLLAWNLSLRYSDFSKGYFEIIVALIFLSAGAYRLARFNVTSFVDKVYTGVPITVAGVILCIYNIYAQVMNLTNYVFNARVTIFLMLILSYLMVSKHRFKKI